MLDTQLRNLMKNNSFCLTGFRDITNVEDGLREFKNVTCDCCNFYIQFGDFYGMYYMDSLGETMGCYFFCIDDYDSILNEYMLINFIKEGEIEAMLPASDKMGLFRKDENVYGFTDEYVLKLLVWTYNSESYALKINCSRLLEKFFDRISGLIQMITMLKRLYFRSFRKAFRPEGKGRKRDLSSFKDSAFCVDEQQN